MPKKMTQDEFIKKAEAKHGDQYDYSLVHYQNANSKVTIICKTCGNQFDQLAGNHLKGKGCRTCSLSQVDTKDVRQQAFIEKAKAVHGDKYDYSFVDYKNNRTRVTLKCNMCGQMITVNPGSHLAGSDCRCQQAAKIESTSMARYGATNAMLNPTIVAKMRETNMQRYGAPTYMQTAEFKEKSVETLMSKYGVDHISKSSFYDEHKDEIVAKIHQSMKKNGSYSTSTAEDEFYSKLVAHFGEDNVIRQYKSELYPYACDFYIVSEDLYIEFNGHWTHGERFYNENDPYTHQFMKRLESKDGKYHKKAKYVFSTLDVEKVAIAKANHLNYVVFWDSELRDVDVWLASGAPIGHDYGEMYTWLPERHFEPVDVTLTGTSMNISKFVQNVHYVEFNKRELALWNANGQHKGLTLQMFLYHNRLKYLGKTPFELSNSEMLRAFTISGVLKRYSRFDNKLMVDVIQKYKPGSIYDPFAGWGERAITASSLGVTYEGVDVNTGLSNGYGILNQMDGVTVGIADSRQYIPSKVDMILSCPPYHDIELYSKDGIENLSKAEFFEAMSDIVDNCLKVDPQYVCFQISNKHQLDMEQILESKGLVKVEELTFDTKKGSHLNYKNGVSTKVSYEVMLVFKKG